MSPYVFFFLNSLVTFIFYCAVITMLVLIYRRQGEKVEFPPKPRKFK